MNEFVVPAVSGPVTGIVSVPGSKSITNRALLAAALAHGNSILRNALFSDDTRWFCECLQKLGIAVEADPKAERFTVHGEGGRIPTAKADLFVGNAGTAARFICCLVALGQGEYRMDGVPRMRQRPMAELISVLERLGSKIHCEESPGYFPCRITASGVEGGEIELKADKTSQQLSALLMAAPYFRRDSRLRIVGELVSRPYIEMTRWVMADFGVAVEEDGDGVFRVKSGGRYIGREYPIEPDASNASYFFAMAALTGGRVTVRDLGLDSCQGDIQFVEILRQMGCRVSPGAGGLTVEGPERLKGIEADMNAISDTVMTLAAIAPFADGPVTIRNVEHIRYKETDRIQALAAELRKMGVQVSEFPDGLRIEPGVPRAATISTYEDHRMAMSFAVTGLKVPGLRIDDPGCTAKTFPDFFDRYLRLIKA